MHRPLSSVLTTITMMFTALLARGATSLHNRAVLPFCSSAAARRGSAFTGSYDKNRGNDIQQQPSHFIVTLERAVGSKVSRDADADLWDSGVFDAEVHPHLPPARTMAGLLAYYMRCAKIAASTALHRREKGGSTIVGDPKAAGDGYLVRSVPVQTFRKKGIRRSLANAAGVDSEGMPLPDRRPADALLLMSGSHPLRRLPFARRVFPDVYDALQLAASMKHRGLLPKDLAMWAVANPLTEANEIGIENLRRKVELGAEVILTQPPLAWELFERWLQGVHASNALSGVKGGTPAKNERAASATITSTGVDKKFAGREQQKEARVLVGMPVITSPAGLRFWLELCGVDKRDQICEEAFAAFETPTMSTAQRLAEGTNAVAANVSGGRKALGDQNSEKTTPDADSDAPAQAEGGVSYGRVWFEKTLLKLQKLDRSVVAGVHVMAPGAGPRRRTKELIDAGVFGKRLR